MSNPYAAPQVDDGVPERQSRRRRFAGFWIRLGALILDGILLNVVFFILGLALGVNIFSQADMSTVPIVGTIILVILQMLVPAAYAIYFWIKHGATLGKMATSVRVIDARSGRNPSLGQAIGRYFAQILSGLPLGLGYVWAAFDSEKRTWHDMLAGTRVIHS